MSLDVYLIGEICEEECICPKCSDVHLRETREELFSANITHNLNCMADAAGIYDALWRPEQIGISTAEQLIDPLSHGLELLKADPEQFKKYNPPNGWGSYNGFVPWVERYLNACKKFPKARVEASR